MALVNHAKKEINAKIIYYGPAGSGKSTTLTYIYSRVKPSLRGELKCVPVGADNLLFFDFSPFEAPLPDGYRVRLHVYTLTGTVTNPATWKMTLKGADGIIIMVDPAAGPSAETRESVSQLQDFLSAYGVGLHETPAVLQLNSFSRGNQPTGETNIAAALDLSSLKTCHTNAVSGEGLLEALAALSTQVLERIKAREQLHGQASSTDNHGPAVAASSEGTKSSLESTTMQGSENIPVEQGTVDRPRVALLTKGLCVEGTTLKIPLEIRHGNTQNRLVITVSVASE